MILTFCPECARPLHKLNDTDYRCDLGHPYFNNPRATCTTVFVNNANEILYTRRAIPPAEGKYDFPGGFLQFSEDAYQGARREMYEELGIRIHTAELDLIDCAHNEYEQNIATCEFIFLCRRWHGELRPSDDVDAFRWDSIDFMRSPKFAWSYSRLYDKLEKIIPSYVRTR